MANIRISRKERRFEFGKYNGFRVLDIIKKDPGYIEFMLSEVGCWLFTVSERRILRNFRSKQNNDDIYMSKVKTRNAIEEEMYKICRKIIDV